MKQGPSKDAVVFAFGRPSAVGHGAYLKGSLFPWCDSLRGKQIFICEWLSVVDASGLGLGTCFYSF